MQKNAAPGKQTAVTTTITRKEDRNKNRTQSTKQNHAISIGTKSTMCNHSYRSQACFREGESFAGGRRLFERERRVAQFDHAREKASPSPVNQAREGESFASC
jgi:hypothetical protein